MTPFYYELVENYNLYHEQYWVIYRVTENEESGEKFSEQIYSTNDLLEAETFLEILGTEVDRAYSAGVEKGYFDS